MPTICELKIELKKKGIKGTTGLNKKGLENLLKTGKPPPKREKENKKEKEETIIIKVKKKPKMIQFTEEKKEERYQGKSAIFLGRLKKKLQALIDNKGATASERNQAINKLKDLDEALIKAKTELMKKRKNK